ncbi:MAG TPA: archaeosortase/exosortase family protein [Caldisericia bacterium]|nr:archaeosortase/exosortase family protein [Caldisericia bacterium]HPF48216.1 archaeosortase/exosortase family protein [Caldisericia bacterium]HPI83848.1 archaeosortase/exosortase family protein [Caldisericia bacterium]HPQ92669.1 archaeosortase/exosortase family protein [Caldisericia bacterium]HRV74233.1 archaeosortase/exosortase family protein [Caldisericia bacterium]
MDNLIKSLVDAVKKYKLVIRWIGLGVIIAIFLQIITHLNIPTFNEFGVQEMYLNPIQKFLTNATSNPLVWLLNLFGINTTFEPIFSGNYGAFLNLQGFYMEIIYECTGIYAWIVYSAAVLAYPTTNYMKNVYGFLIGIPAIYLINLLRFIVLGFVAAYWPAAFDFLHAYLWQLIIIGFILLLFWGFISWIVKEKPQALAEK